jgi:tRNA(Ile)-lysidine synthase
MPSSESRRESNSLTVCPATLLAALPFTAQIERYRLAYSGGLDSHVLLHALASQRDRLHGAELVAVHVDHGLSPNAKQWAEHCAQQCAALGIELLQLSVDAGAEPGESPEAAARHARYRAFAELMHEGDCLLTAHHQDDQAETLLLQLLRGAGPRGLAAMPLWADFAAGWHVRPLLTVSRDALQAYAQQHDLHWVDDESNFDTGFDRNFLRHEILPALKQRFPAAAATLSRSAQHCAEAAQLLAEAAAVDATGAALPSGALSVSALQKLGEMRARNLLHHWIHAAGLPMPSAAHLKRVWEDAIGAAQDSNPLVCWPGAEVRRYRDALFLSAPLVTHDAGQHYDWDLAGPLDISGLGTLRSEVRTGWGLSVKALEDKKLRVRFRQGGETIRPAGRAGHHALKTLLQEAGVPPWQRERLPLLYVDDELVAVADLWVAEEYAAQGEEPGVRLYWEACGQHKHRL